MNNTIAFIEAAEVDNIYLTSHVNDSDELMNTFLEACCLTSLLFPELVPIINEPYKCLGFMALSIQLYKRIKQNELLKEVNFE